jgi:rubrerythrin
MLYRGGLQDMKTETENNLKDAFAGESQAHMRYLSFAARARKDGFGNVGRLFDAASFAEQVHASNHLNALTGVGETSANLAAAYTGEDYEITDMYPSFIGVAKDQGEKAAETSMHYALEAEKRHRELYQRAKEAVGGGGDLQLGALSVCGNCGYTTDSEPPAKCPVCGADRGVFGAF